MIFCFLFFVFCFLFFVFCFFFVKYVVLNNWRFIMGKKVIWQGGTLNTIIDGVRQTINSNTSEEPIEVELTVNQLKAFKGSYTSLEVYEARIKASKVEAKMLEEAEEQEQKALKKEQEAIKKELEISAKKEAAEAAKLAKQQAANRS